MPQLSGDIVIPSHAIQSISFSPDQMIISHGADIITTFDMPKYTPEQVKMIAQRLGEGHSFYSIWDEEGKQRTISFENPRPNVSPPRKTCWSCLAKVAVMAGGLFAAGLATGLFVAKGRKAPQA